MMYYAPDAKPKGMLEDMKRLLRPVAHRLTHAAANRLRWFRRLALRGALLAAVRDRARRLGAAHRRRSRLPGLARAATAMSIRRPAIEFAKALHEMVHRYFASTLGLVIVESVGLGLWPTASDRGQPLLAVAALFVVVCMQGALGALTVTLLLKPLIVTAHLLGGLTDFRVCSAWLSLMVPERARLTAIRGAACANSPLAGPRRARRADRARRLDQQQLRGRGLPGFSDLPAIPGGRPWISATRSCSGAASASITRAACSPIRRGSPFISRIDCGAVVAGASLLCPRNLQVCARPGRAAAMARGAVGVRGAPADIARHRDGAAGRAAAARHTAQRRRGPAGDRHGDAAARAVAGAAIAMVPLDAVPTLTP